jgi:hypothetical protein
VTKSLNNYIDIFMPMTGTVQNGKATTKEPKHSGEDELWPEEEQALKDIKTGKTAMKKQTGKQFLKDLESMVNG